MRGTIGRTGKTERTERAERAERAERRSGVDSADDFRTMVHRRMRLPKYLSALSVLSASSPSSPSLRLPREAPAAPGVRGRNRIRVHRDASRVRPQNSREPTPTAGWETGSIACSASGPIRSSFRAGPIVTARGDTLPLRNFIARFNPAAEKRLLLLAHWDSRPIADSPRSRDSTQAGPRGERRRLGSRRVARRGGCAEAHARRQRAWTSCSWMARTTGTSPRIRQTC